MPGVAGCHWIRATRFLITALFVAVAARPSPAFAAPPWEERDVAIDVGGLTLRGTIVMPAGTDRVTGVLLLAGSGPIDRNGNPPSGHNDVLRRIAYGLANAGIGSLRADKRAVGGSVSIVMREEDLRFDAYADDAVRWVDFLRAQPRIDSVFIIGHSEGALVGTVAAQRTRLDGLVAIAGAGSSVGSVLRQQFATGPVWTPSMRAAAGHIIDELEAGRTVGQLPPELAAMFRPSVQPYLISQFRYDPAVEIARLRLPILIMQGNRDLQISVADAQRLAAAAPKADLVLLDGVNHVLRDAPADRDGNLALYIEPERPLAAAVLPSIIGFVRGAVPVTP